MALGRDDRSGMARPGRQLACLRTDIGIARMPAMSVYALQKLIRDVNRKPACREAFFQSAEKFSESYELTPPERDALVRRDVRMLYAMGVHGLLLRPFTLLHQMPEPDYLKAIRGD
jgi:hypothetical protein